MYSTLDGKIGTRWGVNMYTKRSFNKGYGVGGGGHVKGGRTHLLLALVI